MQAVTLLRDLFGAANGMLEMVTADLTDEQWHAVSIPGGHVHSVAANYMHVVTLEDELISRMVLGVEPLHLTEWAGRAGFTTEATEDMEAWMRAMRIEPQQARDYAQAVYARTDSALAALSDDDLDRTIDLTAFTLGEQPLAMLLGNILLTNLSWHTGEIAAINGAQGLRGYPF